MLLNFEVVDQIQQLRLGPWKARRLSVAFAGTRSYQYPPVVLRVEVKGVTEVDTFPGVNARATIVRRSTPR